MGQAQGLSNPGASGKSGKQALKINTSPTPADLDPGQGGTDGLGRGIAPTPQFLLPLSPSQAVSLSCQGPLPPGDLPGLESLKLPKMTQFSKP